MELNKISYYSEKPRILKKLEENGYFTIFDLARAEPEDLKKIGIGNKTAEECIVYAREQIDPGRMDWGVLRRIRGIGVGTAKALFCNGYNTPETVAQADPEKLVKQLGISEEAAKNIIWHASRYLEDEEIFVIKISQCGIDYETAKKMYREGIRTPEDILERKEDYPLSETTITKLELLAEKYEVPEVKPKSEKIVFLSKYLNRKYNSLSRKTDDVVTQLSKKFKEGEITDMKTLFEFEDLHELVDLWLSFYSELHGGSKVNYYMKCASDDDLWEKIDVLIDPVSKEFLEHCPETIEKFFAIQNACASCNYEILRNFKASLETLVAISYQDPPTEYIVNTLYDICMKIKNEELPHDIEKIEKIDSIFSIYSDLINLGYPKDISKKWANQLSALGFNSLKEVLEINQNVSIKGIDLRGIRKKLLHP